MDKFLAVVAATMALQLDLMDSCMLQVGITLSTSLADRSLHKFGFTDPKIVRFDRDGNLKFGVLNSPTIRVYTPSGVLVRTYTPPSSTGTAGLFIDRAGNRLVGDPCSSTKIHH